MVYGQRLKGHLKLNPINSVFSQTKGLCPLDAEVSIVIPHELGPDLESLGQFDGDAHPPHPALGINLSALKLVLGFHLAVDQMRGDGAESVGRIQPEAVGLGVVDLIGCSVECGIRKQSRHAVATFNPLVLPVFPPVPFTAERKRAKIPP